MFHLPERLCEAHAAGELRRHGRKEIREPGIGDDDAVIGVDQHDRFARIFERPDEPVLGRAALGLFPLDHVADVLLHDRHGSQQETGLVAHSGGDRRLELSRRDAVGDRRRIAQRPDDAPDQQQGQTSGQQQRQDQGRCAGVFKKGDVGDDLAALNKAVAGGQLGEHVEALHDLCGQRAEILDGCRSRLAAQVVPLSHQVLDLADDGFLVVIDRSGGRDRQIIVKEFRQMLDLFVDRGPFLIARRSGAADQLLVHPSEIEAGGAVVIDRHQRTVIELDDEPAGSLQDVQAIAPQRRDQQPHRDERAEDGGADRSREAHPSGSGLLGCCRMAERPPNLKTILAIDGFCRKFVNRRLILPASGSFDPYRQQHFRVDMTAHRKGARMRKIDLDRLSPRLLRRIDRHVFRIDIDLVEIFIFIGEQDGVASRDRDVVLCEVAPFLGDSVHRGGAGKTRDERQHQEKCHPAAAH